MVKEDGVLRAVYDDKQGVTAAFYLNLLRVVKRLLNATFDLERREHVAYFNRDEGRIEMRPRALSDHSVTIAGEQRRFERGECILTECSYQYTMDGSSLLLASAGFARQAAWTDPGGGFGVFLAWP